MTRSITRALAILLLAGSISSGVLAAPTPSSMSSGPTSNGAHSDQVPELAKFCPYSSGGANSVPTHQRRGIGRLFCCPMPRKGNPGNDGNVVTNSESGRNGNPGNTHDSPVPVNSGDQAGASGALQNHNGNFDSIQDRSARNLLHNINLELPPGLESDERWDADISKIKDWVDILNDCLACEGISAGTRKEAQALFDKLNPKLTEQLRHAREHEEQQSGTHTP
ncbi:hypothetical protein EV361DRAFT_362411 [Lentinula raphanica]|uniref:Secreted protein n=1 Tax=Lentinula raphanica TaxID=153919 RepID=A0AA38P650_9AGAR|nr:hypothetical protein F5878DRAFT_236355 [Lentinula raphanica]KAJ3969284.1 hypothetical protein EV361DRAFT_362411 [Lentinula raphanica]